MSDRRRNKIRMAFKHLTGIETEEERQAFETWMEEHPRDRRWYESMEGGREYLHRREYLERLDTEKEWEKVVREGQGTRRLRWRGWAAAAVLLVLGGVGGMLYWEDRALPSAVETGAPGSFGAVLVASDGSAYDLLAKGDTIEVQTERFIVSDSGGITYAGLSVLPEEEQVVYNRLLVSRGHEYMLTLQDGTRVWLNSQSELEYPVVFPRGERRVRLSGEAYFEVAADTAAPFVVDARGDFEIRVLGTHFNVKAYETDDRYETTLVEGRVSVSDTAGLEVTLHPSQQLVLDREGGYEVKVVDTRYYLAWHEGWFYFQDESLEQVLHMVSRWYDVEFEWGEDIGVEGKRVTGKVRRFEQLGKILGMLTKVTGVVFEQDGDRILLRTEK